MFNQTQSIESKTFWACRYRKIYYEWNLDESCRISHGSKTVFFSSDIHSVSIDFSIAFMILPCPALVTAEKELSRDLYHSLISYGEDSVLLIIKKSTHSRKFDSFSVLHTDVKDNFLIDMDFL